MPFRSYDDALFAVFKFEEGNYIIGHELGGQSPTDKRWEFFRADGHVLLDLHDAEPVLTALGLNREYVMDPLLVDAHVNLLGFYLSHAGDACAQMILKRVAGDSRKGVNEPVVAYS